jgi:N-formylglutamate deformylase
MSSEIVDDDVDIVLSNCDGKSSNLAIINSIKNYFNKCGYKVNFNMPFKGGFITRYYGKPEVNVHVIQIEINKKLYLDEKNFNIKDKEFSDLKNCFSEIINYINFNISSI